MAAVAVAVVRWALRRLDRAGALAIGRLLGRGAWSLCPAARSMTRTNLAAALGRAGGVRVMPRGTPLAELIAWLDAGGVVGVVIDQNTRVRSTEASFLGPASPTPLGPALLAARTGAPLLVATIRRALGRGT